MDGQGTSSPVWDGEYQMKFKANVQDFSDALKHCNAVAPTKSAVSTELTGVLIRALEDRVVMMASDDGGVNSVRIEFPAQVQVPGEALVRAAYTFQQVLACFKPDSNEGANGTVVVEKTSKNRLHISGFSPEGKPRKFEPHLMNAGFFIETPTFEPSKATQVLSFNFMDGLNKVAYAASRDANKVYMHCINFTLTDRDVVFAATDGTQIAEFKQAAEVQGLRGSFILGLKFAVVAPDLINPKNHDYVEVYADGDRFFFRQGGKVLVSNLVNADFPDYAGLMGTEGLIRVLFPREQFLNELASVQPSVDVRNHRMVLTASADGTATLFASSSEGEAESSGLDVQTPQDFELHFNAGRLQSGVRQLKGDHFEFYFGENSPGVVLKSEKEDGFRAYVCTLKKMD